MVTVPSSGPGLRAIVDVPTTSSVAKEARDIVLPAAVMAGPPGESVCDLMRYSDWEFSVTSGAGG